MTWFHLQLLLSIGGNDIDYSQLLGSLLSHTLDDYLASVERRFKALKSQLNALAKALKEDLQMSDSRRVLLTQYYDISRNERGVVDGSCIQMRQKEFEKAVREVNAHVFTVSKE